MLTLGLEIDNITSSSCTVSWKSIDFWDKRFSEVEHWVLERKETGQNASVSIPFLHIFSNIVKRIFNGLELEMVLNCLVKCSVFQHRTVVTTSMDTSLDVSVRPGLNLNGFLRKPFVALTVS